MSFWSGIQRKEDQPNRALPPVVLPGGNAQSTSMMRDGSAAEDWGNVGKAVVKTAQGIGQGSMRAFGGVASAITGQPFTPTGPFQEELYGTDQPITPESVGRETRMADPTKKSEGFWARLDPAIGLAAGLADAIPGGKQIKGGLRAIATTFAAEKSAAKIAEDLVAFDRTIDRAIIDDVAVKLAKESDPAKAEKLLSDAGFTGDVKRPSKATEAPEPDDVPEAPKTKERKFITSVREEKPELETRVAGQYVPRDTDTLSIKARNLINDDIGQAEQIAKTGKDENAVAVASELIKKYTDDAAAATDEGVRNTLYDKAADIANSIAERLTEQGRAVQAASILGRLTPEGQVRFAAREIQKYNEAVDKGGVLAPRTKIPELTGEQTGRILEEAKRIEAMPDGRDKARAFRALQDDIAELVPTPLHKKLITVWKAGLLTGIKTTGLNLFSNLFHGVSEVAKDVPAAAVDSMASLFTGERTLALTGRGTGSGLAEGVAKGWDYLKSGFDERDIGKKLDHQKVSFGSSKFAKAVQAYEETVFRVLGTGDQPFYYGAKARSLYSQAIAQAKNLPKEDRAAFIDHMVENPTDAMLKYATIDAEAAVFQNKTVLGHIGQTIQRSGGTEIGQLVVPFARTPASAAMQIINYSPVGLVKTLVENIGKGKFDQRLFSQGVGRSITGTALAYVGTELYDKGLLNLAYPTSERERALWEAEGRKANTILIDGEWRSIGTLGPAGFTLLAGGAFKRAMDETGSPFEALAQAAATTGKSLTEQTFLRGIDQLITTITDPQRSAKGYFAGLIGSLIPTIVSDVARGIDDKERRTPGFLDRAKSRIPGVREGLEPQVTAFGDDLPVKDFLTTMLDPTRPTSAVHDPVIDEVRRLTDAGFEVSPTKLGDKEGYDVLTPEQNTRLWQRAGSIVHQKLGSLFESEKYQGLDDEQKGKAIDKFVDKSKIVARAEMVIELTQGLEGDELRSKFSELKAAKLLTADVYEKVKELR